MSRYWIGVDFDGTLAYYDRFRGNLTFGRPIPKMVRRIQQMLEHGKTVKIFTSRVAPDGIKDVEAIRTALENYTEQHIGVRLEVTCVKDSFMEKLYDDKAVQVITNTGRIVAVK